MSYTSSVATFSGIAPVIGITICTMTTEYTFPHRLPFLCVLYSSIGVKAVLLFATTICSAIDHDRETAREAVSTNIGLVYPDYKYSRGIECKSDYALYFLGLIDIGLSISVCIVAAVYFEIK